MWREGNWKNQIESNNLIYHNKFHEGGIKNGRDRAILRNYFICCFRYIDYMCCFQIWAHLIQPVHSKGYQSCVFIGRTDAKAETPILLPPHAKSWLIGKDSDAGRDWGQEVKGTTEDEMAGWHHWLDGHEFEWTPGVGDGQGGLACCSSWGRRVRHDWVTELNWTELKTLWI